MQTAGGRGAFGYCVLAHVFLYYFVSLIHVYLSMVAYKSLLCLFFYISSKYLCLFVHFRPVLMHLYITQILF